MKVIEHQGEKLVLRRVQDADVPVLRKLINDAYRELSDLGWNYTGTFQDEDKTRERLAKGQGFEGIQLDTAKPATHLVQWYLKRGYEIVGEIRWEGKTYESAIFEKRFL